MFDAHSFDPSTALTAFLALPGWAQTVLPLMAAALVLMNSILGSALWSRARRSARSRTHGRSCRREGAAEFGNPMASGGSENTTRRFSCGGDNARPPVRTPCRFRRWLRLVTAGEKLPKTRGPWAKLCVQRLPKIIAAFRAAAGRQSGSRPYSARSAARLPLSSSARMAWPRRVVRKRCRRRPLRIVQEICHNHGAFRRGPPPPIRCPFGACRARPAPWE